jgi:hypothetical protein
LAKFVAGERQKGWGRAEGEREGKRGAGFEEECLFKAGRRRMR